MDRGRAATSSSTASSGQAGDGEFPAGLRVLVVDDDATCLKILEKMLRNCLYDVTTCSRAEAALSKLRERKGAFDVVLSDVYMPDMDGFKLLEHVGLEMDLPVIMMSADDGKDVVMKGVTHGACDYLIKPVRMEALKNIWQHVVRKKRNEHKELEHSGSTEESDKPKKVAEDGDHASSASAGIWKNVKRRKEGEEEEELDEREDPSTLKKPRVVWSVDLHQQFVVAVNQLGVDKAVPKKILELMNVPGLTRENVASHLQKYRLYLRRLSLPQHQGRVDTSFTGATESAFGSLDGFDLQALAVSGQLPQQSLMTLHSGPGRSTSNGMVSAVNQIGFFNPGAQIANASNIKSESVQQVNHKQINYLRGPSISTEPRHGQSQQVVQSYGNIGLQVSDGTSGFYNLPSSQRINTSYPGGMMNGHLSNSLVMQMTQQGQQFSLSQKQNHLNVSLSQQTQSRGQLLNEAAGQHDSRLLTSMGQQILSNNISGRVSGRAGSNTNAETSLPGNYINTSYGSVSQAIYAEFPSNCMSESAGSYPPVNTVGASNLTSSAMFQQVMPAVRNTEALSNVNSFKGVKDYVPNYDIFSELCQGKNQDWKMQNINLSYQPAQSVGSKQNNIDFGSSILARQDSVADIKDGSDRNSCTVTKEILSVRREIEHGVRVKAETVPPSLSYQDVLFDDNIIQNELMNVVGKQRQEGAGQVDPEFNFDGCPLDNISV